MTQTSGAIHTNMPCPHPTLSPIIARMKEQIEQRRRQRAQFLMQLYDVVDANVSTFVSAWEIAASIGMPDDEAQHVLEYYAEKGFILVDDHRAGTVRLTAAGVDHVEDARMA